jgi:hypothetical protein
MAAPPSTAYHVPAIRESPYCVCAPVRYLSRLMSRPSSPDDCSICYRDDAALVAELDEAAEALTAKARAVDPDAHKITRSDLMRRFHREGLERLRAADAPPTEKK